MKILPQYFGASYVISLPERADRLQAAKREFARAGWGESQQGVQVLWGHKFAERGGFPNPGARGAFRSHWECLQRAEAAGSPRVLVLEDDIGLARSLAALTPSIIAQLEAAEWDLVYFGHLETGEIPDATAKTESGDIAFLAWSGDIQGLHFYGVNGRILPRLNAHLERVATGTEGDQLMGPMPVDGALNTFRRLNPDVRTLIASPKLGWQRPSRSDISPKRFDDIQLLRPALTVLRSIKHAVKMWRS